MVSALGSYTDAGVRFVFGSLVDTGFSFAVNVLPMIVFMGSVFAVLYHLGVMQRVVNVLAAALGAHARHLGRREPGRGRERLPRHDGIRAGRAPLPRAHDALRALLPDDGRHVDASPARCWSPTSAMLGGGDFAGHLATASLLSAPAGILVAKLMVPETEVPETAARRRSAVVARTAVNVFDAAAEGAIGGLRLAAYVGALLVAFVALIALANDACGFVGGWFGAPASHAPAPARLRARAARARDGRCRGRTPCRSAGCSA